MTRKEEYHCVMLAVYKSGLDFIKSSKKYHCLKLGALFNAYINLIAEVIYCAWLDDFITLGDYNELLNYGDRLINYIKECLK